MLGWGQDPLGKRRRTILALVIAVLMPGAVMPWAANATTPADKDMAIAESLAELLQDARTIISNEQDVINDPALGDKHLTGEMVLDRAIKIYAQGARVDPRKVDPASREGRLLRAMMAAVAGVIDDNQQTINAKGIGFKGFIPAVFGRLVAEEFGRLAKGEAVVKITAPPELVRNRKARPDQWEAEIIKTKLLDPAWSTGQPYSAIIETNGRPAFRVMVPEYYVESCLACHGSPKGEIDITGYPKEGGKLNDLGAAISITLYR
jgi:Protein of unknown function (DUF3365)